MKVNAYLDVVLQVLLPLMTKDFTIVPQLLLLSELYLHIRKVLCFCYYENASEYYLREQLTSERPAML